jgi:hypothetical protein
LAYPGKEKDRALYESDTGLEISMQTVSRKLTGERCRCSACGEYFNSVSVFDKHRIGTYENSVVGRRCLSVSEMLARSWIQNDVGG